MKLLYNNSNLMCAQYLATYATRLITIYYVNICHITMRIYQALLLVFAQ
jgi:hypothetical protein